MVWPPLTWSSYTIHMSTPFPATVSIKHNDRLTPFRQRCPNSSQPESKMLLLYFLCTDCEIRLFLLCFFSCVRWSCPYYTIKSGHTPKLGEISGGFIGTDYVGIEGREVAMNHRHKNNGAGGVTRCVDELARTVPERVPRDKVPENARIICFPLEPKPHNVDAEWITRFWFGVEANDAGMA